MCLLIAYECEDITSIDNMITRINISSKKNTKNTIY